MLYCKYYKFKHVLLHEIANNIFIVSLMLVIKIKIKTVVEVDLPMVIEITVRFLLDIFAKTTTKCLSKSMRCKAERINSSMTGSMRGVALLFMHIQ